MLNTFLPHNENIQFSNALNLALVILLAMFSLVVLLLIEHFTSTNY